MTNELIYPTITLIHIVTFAVLIISVTFSFKLFLEALAVLETKHD